MTSQNVADIIGLLILIVGATLGFIGAPWLYVVGLAMAGTLAMWLLKPGLKSPLLPIERLGLVGLLALQLVNASALYGVGWLIRYLFD